MKISSNSYKSIKKKGNKMELEKMEVKETKKIIKGKERTFFVLDKKSMKLAKKIVKKIVLKDTNDYALKKGKDNISFVAKHKRNNTIVVMDIKNFFETLAPEIGHYFEENREMVSEAINKAKTSGVPRGLPFSNLLAEESFKVIDKEIREEVKLEGVTITRYCDDIMVSKHYEKEDRKRAFVIRVIAKVQNVLERHNLSLNKEKTKYTLCGEIANAGVSIKKGRVRTTKEFNKKLDGATDPAVKTGMLLYKNRIKEENLEW